MTAFWDTVSCSVTLMIKAVRTFETSVNFYQTIRRNSHTRRLENLKSHKKFPVHCVHKSLRFHANMGQLNSTTPHFNRIYFNVNL
jgi:hypothetical protein